MKVVCDSTGNPALIGRDQHGKADIVADGELGDVVDLDGHRPHAVGWAVCRCGHSSLVVVDVRANYDQLECRGCGDMAAVLQANKPADVIPIKGAE